MRWVDLQHVSISRLEERHPQGWLGQNQRNPGEDPPARAWSGPEHEPEAPKR